MAKEHRVKRINFVSKKGLALDYQHIIYFFVLWLFFLFVISGLLHARLLFIRHSVKTDKEQLAALMQDQERRLAMLELAGPRMDRVKKENLLAIFENPPHWSALMKELKKIIPSRIRLNQVKTTEDVKEGRFHIRIDGVSPSMHTVIEFMRNLQSSKVFKDVILVEAKMNKDEHSVTCVVEAMILII